MPNKSRNKWQYGDFQTPVALVEKVIGVLKRNHHISPDVIIEPTCGKGAFVQAAYRGFDRARTLGFEINPHYVEEAKAMLKSEPKTNRVTVEVADFFSTDWEKILSDNPGYVLVIGNPPWVTNSELSSLNSQNLPVKSNLQNCRGIEAITGSANFDISEWMLLQHVKWLSKREGVIAFLCKCVVARKIMRQVKASHRFSGHIYPIDARYYFGASVEACLFVLTTEIDNADCEVYKSLDSPTPAHVIGERDGSIVLDVEKYGKWKHLRGQDPRYVWRSGVKHDCAKIMELYPVNGTYKNGLGEAVECEQNYIYPLLKSSDVGNGRTKTYRKVVLITQKYVGEDTSKIQNIAPETWAYLTNHRNFLDKRKSSIYKNKPSFSVFGIGEYSFRPWKIAISGLYKNLKFNQVEPLDGKPVIFDDTINFLSFDNREEAEFIYQIITSPPAREFLESMIFRDEKRPITTEILRRLSLKAVSEELGKLQEYQKWSHVQSESFRGQLELGIAESES